MDFYSLPPPLQVANDMKANLQTKFFCGFHPVCDNICSAAALLRAKRVLEERYVLVGTLEMLEGYIKLLERLLPTWFGGALAAYHSADTSFQDAKKTQGKMDTVFKIRTHASDHAKPTAATTRLLASIHSQDVALYAFATDLLQRKLEACTG